jgi:hypothetical protein
MNTLLGAAELGIPFIKVVQKAGQSLDKAEWFVNGTRINYPLMDCTIEADATGLATADIKFLLPTPSTPGPAFTLSVHGPIEWVTVAEE